MFIYYKWKLVAVRRKTPRVSICGLPSALKCSYYFTFTCCHLVSAFLEQEHGWLGRFPHLVVINKGNSMEIVFPSTTAS